jgi:hypothetical protein
MGNYALGFGIQGWFATPRPTGHLFDAVVLAAADEFSTTFDGPNGARLSDLWELTQRITVYSSREDVLMLASRIANREWRLGHDGPPNRADQAFFPRTTYDFIDCTDNRDYTTAAPDDSHQYYRQSRTVRSDIARVLKGLPTDTRTYDKANNVFTLLA